MMTTEEWNDKPTGTQAMTAPELKPCPFCGGEASLEMGPRVYGVECATGSSCVGSGLLIGFMHDALDSAVAQRNTRAKQAQAAIARAEQAEARERALIEGAEINRQALLKHNADHARQVAALTARARHDALEEAARELLNKCHDDMTREEEAASIRALKKNGA
jgi:hypothetical protein